MTVATADHRGKQSRPIRLDRGYQPVDYRVPLRRERQRGDHLLGRLERLYLLHERPHESAPATPRKKPNRPRTSDSLTRTRRTGSACMGAISRIYDADEDRKWCVRFPISLGIAAVLAAALVGVIFLGNAASTAVRGGWSFPFALGRWLLAALLIGLAFGLLVRYAPA